MPTKPKKNYTSEPGIVNPKDCFSTPRYATELLVPYIPPDAEIIWEPAAGEGKIVEVLKSYDYEVMVSDIQGTYADEYYYWDFLNMGFNLIPRRTVIITNPPFSLKKKFFLKCLEYNVPFALLLPLDFNGWMCEAFDKYGCQGLVPNRRIDFITPNNKKSSAQFHAFWLTYGFNMPDQQLVFVELTKQMKENI